jgi:hypothetical protein
MLFQKKFDKHEEFKKILKDIVSKVAYFVIPKSSPLVSVTMNFFSYQRQKLKFRIVAEFGHIVWILDN